MPELQGKRERFCREYLIDLNATKAYQRAGYNAPASAHALGHQLMQRPEIIDRIAELSAERTKELKLEANDIIIELLRILTSDPLNYVNDDGTVKSLADIPIDARRAIANFEVDTVGTTGAVIRTKVRFWSKEKAAELLGKHLTLFKDVLAVEGLDEIAKLIVDARSRVPDTFDVEDAREVPRTLPAPSIEEPSPEELV